MILLFVQLSVVLMFGIIFFIFMIIYSHRKGLFVPRYVYFDLVFLVEWGLFGSLLMIRFT